MLLSGRRFRILLHGVIVAALASAPTRAASDPPALTFEALGLSFTPPAEAIVTDRSSGDQIDVALVDAATPATWSMRVVTLRSTLEPGPDGIIRPEDQIEHLLRQRREQGLRLAVRVSEAVAGTFGTGRFCCVEEERTASGEDDGTGVVVGWAILPLGGDLLLVVSLQADRAAFDDRVLPRARALLASIRTTDLSEITAERRERLEAGAGVLALLTPERLRGMADPARWYRLSTDANGITRELGCFRIESAPGPRGSVNLGRDPGSYTGVEREEGLLVAVQGHLLTERPDTIFASEGVYWIAFDGAAETWSVRQTLYQGPRDFGRREESTAISGVRDRPTASHPGGLLQVVVMSRNGTERDAPSPMRVPDVYFPQAMRWLEGFLLAPVATEPATFSYYCVDTSDRRVAVTPRVDVVTPGPAGMFTVLSRPRQGVPATESTYDAAGRLLRRVFPDGSRLEPIELDALIRLWRERGIGTDGLRLEDRR